MARCSIIFNQWVPHCLSGRLCPNINYPKASVSEILPGLLRLVEEALQHHIECPDHLDYSQAHLPFYLRDHPELVSHVVGILKKRHLALPLGGLLWPDTRVPATYIVHYALSVDKH